MSLRGRIERIEQTTRAPSDFMVVIVDRGETEDDAVSRTLRESGMSRAAYDRCRHRLIIHVNGNPKFPSFGN